MSRFLAGIKAVSRKGPREAARENWCWAMSVALRASLVLVQDGGCSVLWGHGEWEREQALLQEFLGAMTWESACAPRNLVIQSGTT